MIDDNLAHIAVILWHSYLFSPDEVSCCVFSLSRNSYSNFLDLMALFRQVINNHEKARKKNAKNNDESIEGKVLETRII